MSPSDTEGSGGRIESNGGGDHDGIRKPSAEPARRLSPSEPSTAIVHLYRAEVGRAVEWRHRLDMTTNWAVVTTGLAISFALGSHEPQRHIMILLVSILVMFFLLFEARRYRHYDALETRVRILERELYAPLLDPEDFPPDPNWQKSLAADLHHPHYHISFAEALGWRLRRNYIWIFLTHLLTWFVKIAIHPEPINKLGQFFERATVGPVPGWIMIVIGVVFNTTLIVLTLVTTRHLHASGEIMPASGETVD